jgi:hypothetical protein
MIRLAKKHIKRINSLLNTERCALNAIDGLDASNTEKMAFWVQYGHEAATTLYTEYGIVSCGGSLKYWDNMMHNFVRKVA